MAEFNLEAWLAKLRSALPRYSPLMAAIIGSITRDGTVYDEFAITSDVYVIAQPGVIGHRESGDFLGDSGQFFRNIEAYLTDAGLTIDEQREFRRLLNHRIIDHRT